MTATGNDRAIRMLGRPRTDGLRGWWLKKLLLVGREYCYDAVRFATHSGAVSPRKLATLRALVTMDTHRIEKGLAVSEPKPWFGRAVLERLVDNTLLYSHFGGDEDVCRASIDALTDYFDRTEIHQLTEPMWVPELKRAVVHLRDLAHTSCLLGGTTTVSRESIHKSGKLESLDFFSSRHSIRDFAPDLVSCKEIDAAVAAAQNAPSVCNRQSWSVYVYPRGVAADTVLACQNGNTGFGHTASHLLLITVDLRAFVYLGERNQGWIDGGMFAMSLVHAFHAQGIGTCCLNWSVDSKADRRLRAVAEIPRWESVIMMLAIGRLPEHLQVASSRRRPSAELAKPGRLRRTNRER